MIQFGTADSVDLILERQTADVLTTILARSGFTVSATVLPERAGRHQQQRTQANGRPVKLTTTRTGLEHAVGLIVWAHLTQTRASRGSAFEPHEYLEAIGNLAEAYGRGQFGEAAPIEEHHRKAATA